MNSHYYAVHFIFNTLTKLPMFTPHLTFLISCRRFKIFVIIVFTPLFDIILRQEVSLIDKLSFNC